MFKTSCLVLNASALSLRLALTIMTMIHFVCVEVNMKIQIAQNLNSRNNAITHSYKHL